MKAYHLTATGFDGLKPVEVDIPRPQAGEVLIKLHAASLNYIDLAVASGAFPAPQLPLIPVADGAGEVVECGEGVAAYKPGDRVLPHFLPDWQAGRLPSLESRPMRGITVPGSLADYLVMPAYGLASMPGHLSYEEGATLSIAATTAWKAVRTGNLCPGKTVLLLGTGGVSLFALQFAKASGARVIIISSSDKKLDQARVLGADEVINYRRVDAWDENVLELTDGQGVDLVVETVGPETFARSLNATAIEGTVFMVGFISGDMLNVSLLPVLLKTLRLVGSNTGSVADFREMVTAIGANGLRPVIDRSFDFDEARQAYELMAQGGHFGKIAIRI